MVRTIIAIIVGLVVGGVVNMGLIVVGGRVIGPPEGADVATYEGLKASMHLFEPRHFLFPFLAHALGTLVGAAVAALVSRRPGAGAGPTRRLMAPLVVGGFFLAGGIVNSIALPAPAWFIALDLIVAYIPMAWLGGRLGGSRPAGVR